jgi:hypothetical protein
MYLTEDQRDKIPSYLREYTSIVRDTSPMDWEGARKSVTEMYRLAGYPPPPKFLFCRNPVLATQAGDLIAREGHKGLGIQGDGIGGRNLLSATSHAAGAARFSFLVNECGLRLDCETQRQTLDLFVRSCFAVYTHANFAILVDRPSVLRVVRRGESEVLHCEDGPAVAWGRDGEGKYDPKDPFGYALYYWFGVRVPNHWITDKVRDPEGVRLRAEEVLTNKNQEVLRAGCEIVGWVPILQSLGMRVLDENPNPIFGKLVSVNLPGAPNSKFIVAACGTGRTIAVPAHPDSTSALDAGARSYGVSVEVYRRLKVRT